jgi:hypothetical protein
MVGIAILVFIATAILYAANLLVRSIVVAINNRCERDFNYSPIRLSNGLLAAASVPLPLLLIVALINFNYQKFAVPPLLIYTGLIAVIPTVGAIVRVKRRTNLLLSISSLTFLWCCILAVPLIFISEKIIRHLPYFLACSDE